MKRKEREILWKLYSIVNKLGGKADYTAVSQKALIAYKQAHAKVSIVISLIITGEDDELCQQYINELDALSRWNFGDKYGNISKEEFECNKRIKEVMRGWTPLSDI